MGTGWSEIIWTDLGFRGDADVNEGGVVVAEKRGGGVDGIGGCRLLLDGGVVREGAEAEVGRLFRFVVVGPN